MAGTPSLPPTPASSSAIDTSYYWCYHCSQRVSVETLPNLPDVVCRECKNGFVESITVTSYTSSPSVTPSPASDPAADDSSFGAQFLQMLRIISQPGRDEEAPPPRNHDPQSDDDFLRTGLEGLVNDEDEDEDEEGVIENDNEERNRDEGEGEGEEGEDRFHDENEDGRVEEDDEEDFRRRRREMIRLQIRDYATRARSGRNRILDWAEILMGLDDNSIELRWEVPDRYIGNPEDYVDAAGYEALLQNLAENDSSGRRGAPPALKSVVSALPKVEIASEAEAVLCAICKDTINVGETETRLPCGHGYHGDCIVPWLESRNSCPVCRFELPTNDTEYEEEKKKRAAAVAGGASGSG